MPTNLQTISMREPDWKNAVDEISMLTFMRPMHHTTNAKRESEKRVGVRICEGE